MMPLTRGETAILRCLIETSVAPFSPLPQVNQTGAVKAFEVYLERSPKHNRLALRAALRAVNLAPFLVGYRQRFKKLQPQDQLKYLKRLARTRLYLLVKMITGLAKVVYYSDPGVMKIIGYDAAAKLAAGRRVRKAEGRW